MKPIKVAAFAINVALYVALGVLLSTVAPINFGGVRFWPQVIIPAIFAVVFGPWVGGCGAALGIFINDVLLGGSPLLSLMAGVTSNFIGFWLIGYLTNKKINLKKSALIYGAITVICTIIAYVYTSFFMNLIYVGVIIASYLIFILISKHKSKWCSYEISAVTGLLVGSAIIGLIVPLYAVLFAPGFAGYTSLTAVGVLALFTWTFATEIPFLLVLGPPILEAIYKAFPTLVTREQREDK